MNNDFQISTPSVSFASQGAAKGGVLTTRTSSKTFQSVGSGSEVFFEPDWQGLNSYSIKRTTSFSDIHQEVAQSVSDTYSAALMSETTPPGPPGPGGPAIGEDKPGSPVGDMLLPMLVIALGYVVVKLFRNRKTSQAL
jgi:hypothetical protein